MSNEIVAVDDSTAPSLANQFDIVDVESAAAFMQNYQDLVNQLLDKSDYQMINGVPKKKKSAWRKLATAFNISDDIVEEEITRDECHRIISAKFVVKATLPNGRYGMGVGVCSIYDKINKKDKEEPSPFELRQRFTNAEHDVTSTAHTRAKSRAISDLVGGGEVSAEELEGGVTGKKPKPVKPKAPKKDTQKAPVKHEAIEVDATVEDMSNGKPSMSLKEVCNSNKHLQMCVKELQANGEIITKERIHDKLMDLWDMGKFSTEDYKKAKALLE